MKTIIRDRSAETLVPAAAGYGRPTLLPRLLCLGRALRQAYMQVFGIPDFERYLIHMAAHHPGEPVLSRREFFARSIDRKYCRNGPRCC